ARLQDGGLRLRDVAGDGHCQFRAIAHQLAALSLPIDAGHEELRRRCVQWLRQNGCRTINGVRTADFVALPEHPEGITLSQYCDRMAAQTAARFGRIYWGDHATLLATASIFSCKIRVYSSLSSWDAIQTPRTTVVG
ncbi:MAG: hypothetical protein QF681_15295, partial [Vicinamibacterales bacterium]|nr:hypothetical protein [Vicinamibacterales bacterium]